MEPTINVGDIIFTKETQDINKGDIISFKANSAIVTHRVVDVIIDENNQKQYKTKGDANASEDVDVVKIGDIEGKYCFKIPKVGNIILFLRNGIGIIIVAVIIVIYLFFTSNDKENVKRQNKKGKHSL